MVKPKRALFVTLPVMGLGPFLKIARDIYQISLLTNSALGIGNEPMAKPRKRTSINKRLAKKRSPSRTKSPPLDPAIQQCPADCILPRLGFVRCKGCFCRGRSKSNGCRLAGGTSEQEFEEFLESAIDRFNGDK